MGPPSAGAGRRGGQGWLRPARGRPGQRVPQGRAAAYRGGVRAPGLGIVCHDHVVGVVKLYEPRPAQRLAGKHRPPVLQALGLDAGDRHLAAPAQLAGRGRSWARGGWRAPPWAAAACRSGLEGAAVGSFIAAGATRGTAKLFLPQGHVLVGIANRHEQEGLPRRVVEQRAHHLDLASQGVEPRGARARLACARGAAAVGARVRRTVGAL
jgi:hypothetical protein